MRHLLFIFLITVSFAAAAQNSKYWVQFTDKSNTPYSISNPSEFLSERAIARRARQNIPVTTTDLPVSPAYIDSLKAAGAKIIHTSKWLNAATIEANSATFEAILQFSFIAKTDTVAKRALKNEREKLEKESAATPTFTVSDYGPAFHQLQMLNGHHLHNLGYKGKGMIIAVMDAGFPKVDELAVFEPLINENRLLATRDFVDGDNNVFHSSTHGTNVLSIMAAYEPGFYIGAAPEASYILLRTENTASELPIEEDNWVAAAEFADSMGADIFNTSLGYTTFDDPFTDHTYGDMDGNTTRITKAADIAASKGILVVTSAGNEGHLDWKYISAPADGDSVLAVGAVDSLETYASFSSQGPSSDGDVKPNIVAQGAKTAFVHTSGVVVKGGGTSFSAPIIAGLAACLWQAYPEQGSMSIYRSIERSAHLHDNPTNLLGHGIPDFHLAFTTFLSLEGISFNKEQKVWAFPNPFSDQVVIYLAPDIGEVESIELLNMQGQVLFRKESVFTTAGVNSEKILTNIGNIKELAQGIYLLKVQTEENSYYFKLLQQ